MNMMNMISDEDAVGEYDCWLKPMRWETEQDWGSMPIDNNNIQIKAIGQRRGQYKALVGAS